MAQMPTTHLDIGMVAVAVVGVVVVVVVAGVAKDGTLEAMVRA